MLLDMNYEVINRLELKFIYDDDSVKTQMVDIGDYVSLVYNRDGMRTSIDGYVSRIYQDHGYRDCQPHWFIILSSNNTSTGVALGKIEVRKIIDLDVLTKASESNEVLTPSDAESRITNIRLKDNVFEISQDYGSSWVAVTPLTTVTPPVEDDTLMQEVDAIVPDTLRSDIQEQLMKDIYNLVNKYKCTHSDDSEGA